MKDIRDFLKDGGRSLNAILEEYKLEWCQKFDKFQKGIRPQSQSQSSRAARAKTKNPKAKTKTQVANETDRQGVEASPKEEGESEQVELDDDAGNEENQKGNGTPHSSELTQLSEELVKKMVDHVEQNNLLKTKVNTETGVKAVSPTPPFSFFQEATICR